MNCVPQQRRCLLPDGIGPVAFLVGGSLGEARTLALDEKGRTLNYGFGEGLVIEIALCPGSRSFAELVSDDDGLPFTTMVAVRNTDTLDVVWEREVHSLTRHNQGGLHPSTISCRDPTGNEVLVFGSDINSSGTDGHVIRVTRNSESTLWRGNARIAVFAKTRRAAYLAGNGKFFELDLSTTRIKDVVEVPSSFVSQIVLSPEETKAAVTTASTPGQRSVFLLIQCSREFTRHEGVMRSFVAWIDDERFLMYSHLESETMALFTRSLEHIGGWNGWRGGESVVRNGVLYSAEHGEMRSASALNGGVRVLRTFESPNQFALVPLTAPIETTRPPITIPQPQVDKAAGREGVDVTTPSGAWALVAAAGASALLMAAFQLRSKL